MTFDFNKLVTIGFDKWKTAPFRFYGDDEMLNIGGGKVEPTWRDVILSGVGSLTLANAKADSLNYVKLFGGTQQRNLPSEYTQVNYVTNTAKTWLDTGVKFDFSKNYEIELRVRGTLSSWYILQAREDAYAPIYGISGSMNNQNIILAFNDSRAATTQITRINGNIYYIKGIINNGNLTLYVKDETAGTEETVTGTYTPSTGTSVNIGLLGNGVIAPSGLQAVDINSDVYFARIKEDGNYILNYVPCRQIATAGFYDKVSGAFKTTNDLVADGNTVPTPDTPMDIVSNNGEIKVRNKSGLPLSYQKVEFLQSTGYERIKTQYYMDFIKDWQIEGEATYIGGNNYRTVIFGNYDANSGSNAASFALEFNNKRFRIYSFDGDWNHSSINDYIGDIPDNTDVKFTVSYNSYANLITTEITYNGETFNSSCSSQTPGIKLYNSQAFFLDYRPSSAADAIRNPLKIKYLKVSENNILAANFITAQNKSDSTLGIYDTISMNFLTNELQGSFTSGAIDDEVEIYTDGTIETVEVDTTGDTATAEMLLSVGDYKDVQSILDGNVTRNVGIKVLDGTEDWTAYSQISSLYYTENTITDNQIGSASPLDLFCTHFAATNTAIFDEDNLLRFQRSTAPYVVISHRLYIKCSEYSTVALFKQFLAAQYANGTPVTIVYPLATPTTESVTPQSLSIQAGTNIITAEGSIDNLPLEVSYKAGVRVTITEVQNAQLDDNVEVTING